MAVESIKTVKFRYQKALFAGLIFGGTYYWKKFCVSKWVGLDNKNSLKHLENSLKQLTLTVPGLIFRRVYYWKEFCVSKWVGLDNKNSLKHLENSLKQLTLTVHGLIFRRAYYRKDICV